jgi:F-box protein 18 (helicase)
LGMMVDIVKEYGNEIPGIIKAIKDKHIDGDEKEKAEIIFSTVHRCKGMEYDAIELVNDFITEEKLEKLKEDSEKNLNIAKLNEEINLLYVAITRTRHTIYIPETLMPVDFPHSPQIHVMKVLTDEVEKEKPIVPVKPVVAIEKKEKKEPAYSVDAMREKHKDAYRPWTDELDNELTLMYCEDVKVKDMATHFGRTKGAILSRIKKLELEELYE